MAHGFNDEMLPAPQPVLGEDRLRGNVYELTLSTLLDLGALGEVYIGRDVVLSKPHWPIERVRGGWRLLARRWELIWTPPRWRPPARRAVRFRGQRA